jgi:hypothetical protein
MTTDLESYLMKTYRLAQAYGLAIGLIVAPQMMAAQDVAWVWNDRAELSVVWTGGNASSNTLGIKNTLTGERGAAKVNLEAGGIRTESSITTRVANGTPTLNSVSEIVLTQLTAESYFARGQFNYGVTERTYWFGGGGWDRNTFSGIDNRFAFVSGGGAQFSDTDDLKFRSDLGVTYTIQDNLSAGPLDRFAGLRLTWDLTRKATETTTFDSKLVLDENLQDTEDFRADLTNSISVAMNDRMALKTSLQVLFDNQPSFLDGPFFPGGNPAGTVAAQLKKMDSVFTVALVINVS